MKRASLDVGQGALGAVVGPLLLFACVRSCTASAWLAAGGTRQGLMLGRSAKYADCAVLLGLGVAPSNSLRSTSFRCVQTNAGESDIDARKRADPQSCAARRPRNRPCRVPPAASRNHLLSLAGREPTLPAKARAGRSECASEALRSGRLVARARSAHRGLTCRRLSERSETKLSEVSSATGHEPEHRKGVGVPADRRSEALRPARTRLCRTNARS